MPRKTVPVEDLIERVNRMIDLARTPGERTTLAVLLESVLMDTGNYNGFQYLPSEFLPGDEQARTGKVLRDDFDDTRRHYYYR